MRTACIYSEHGLAFGRACACPDRNSVRPPDWRHCRTAKELGVPIEIGPDAHSERGLDNVDIGIGMGRKAWLTANDVFNTRSADEIVAFAREKRSR